MTRGMATTGRMSGMERRECGVHCQAEGLEQEPLHEFMERVRFLELVVLVVSTPTKESFQRIYAHHHIAKW